jgi:predicted aspartyl protease
MRIPTLVTLVSLALSTAEAAVTPEEVALSVRRSGALLASVVIDGHGPFTFLLDTGSSHTVVGSELAERLALPAVAQARVLTTAGAQMGLVVRVGRLSIGGASVENLMPSVVSIAGLRQIEKGVDGVIGLDFLSAFNYTVDYRRKRLRFTAEHEDEQVRMPLVRAGERSLVQLPGDVGRGPVLMVPDSGSEGFVLFERNGRTAVTVDYGDQLVGVSGLASRRTGRAAMLRELNVGGVTLRNQPAVVLEREGPGTVEGDGLMPLHQFSSVSFNNSEGYMVVRK